MSNRASAARYAKAIFQVGVEEGGLEQIETDLTDFAELLQQNAELRKALLHPAVPTSAKRLVIDRVLERAAPQPPVLKLLALLADRDRLELVPDVAEAYRARLMERQHVVRADIVTAVPLAADRAAQLKRRLGDATGRVVTMSTQVDPSILGGVIATIGSTVYDGSIATQLTKMRERLTK